MARSALEALWAMVREEQNWLEVVRADLQWLCEVDRPWPDLQAHSWPELVHLFRDRASWIKRESYSKSQDGVPPLLQGAEDLHRPRQQTRLN